MRSLFTRLFPVLFLLSIQMSVLFAGHNGSRYFPFLERPQNYVPRKPYLHAAAFYTTASSAFKRGGGQAGIPELWGTYDLQNVIQSLQAVQGAAFVNPIVAETGSNEFADPKVALKFEVCGRVRSKGLILNYEHNFKWMGLSVGVWLPIVTVDSLTTYNFSRKDFQPGRALTLEENGRIDRVMDKIRRTTHDAIGFTSNQWTKTGFGDLDFHLRHNYSLDHKWLMRTINFDTQLGVIAPTGILSDNNNPSSVSVMGDGHWALYLDFVPEFELKQDLKVGMMLGGLFQLRNQRNMRIPVYKEPAIYSALTGKLQVDPGWTFKFSPYVIAENLTDGVHFQARYTYLHHTRDKYTDVRPDKTIQSYLTRVPGNLSPSQDDIDQNIEEKRSLSKWTSHYISLEVAYNSKDALQNWTLNPNLYLVYDWPISGNGSSKTHQITFGAELHF